MIVRHYPDYSYYHRQSAKNDNFNIWGPWLYQREIGCQPPLGFRDRQQKDTNLAIRPVSSWGQSRGNTNHGAVFNLEFSPDGRILLGACEGKSYLVFDPLNGQLVNHVGHAHNGGVNCIRFLDSRMFATCSDDMTVALWDIRFPKNRIRSLRGHSNWVKNIEYATSSRLLVSSGFDGSVFVWDINKYTEDMQYKQVCHVGGLMRTKLTPDEKKLILCTTAGYMMIINDLDLNSLADDLSAFNPNLYRLMQLSGTPNATECRFNKLFSAKRNRVEFVSDFPDGNAAEIISSLQIHPQGWCVLSRNTSSDKESEWTCVHNIQDIKPDDDFDEYDDSDDVNHNSDDSLSTPDVQGPSTSDSTPPRSRSVIHLNLNYPDGDDDNHQLPSVNVQLNNSDVFHLPSSNIRPIEINGGSQLAQALILARSMLNQQDVGHEDDEREDDGRRELNWNALLPATDRVSILLRAMQAVSDAAAASNDIPNASSPNPESSPENCELPPSRLRIRSNQLRLTHYCVEMNVGPGFIKELCFSTDGRLVCSPYAQGIRLFAFDSECRELCDAVPSQPQKLHLLVTNRAHKNVVVSTQYSPTHPLIVSGCLNGKVCFYQPVLT